MNDKKFMVIRKAAWVRGFCAGSVYATIVFAIIWALKLK